MTITIEAKLLRAATAEAASVAAGGADVPILGNVLLDAKAGELRLVSTDLDSMFERRVAAEAGEPLAVTVSARFLAAIAAKLPDGSQVSIGMQGNAQLTIAAGRARFALATLPAKDFPVFPDEEWDAEFELGAGELAELLDAVGFAVSTEETRYYLNGVYLHVAEAAGAAVLRAAGTDGHRLARFQRPLPAGAESLPKKGVIVPTRAVRALQRLIGHIEKGEGDPEPLQVAVSARRIRVEFPGGGTIYTSKLVDGEFPDYARVIPAESPRLLKVDKAALKEAAERVATIASEKTRAVKLDLSREMLKLEVTSPEAGTASEELACDYGPASAADPLQLGFNAKYLGDLLGHIPGETVAVEIGADGKAATLWRDAADTGAADALTRLYVLMPMRV